ncbi:heat shock 70 kDa protein 12B-like [Mytilus edulis]|uniref:heat shock 70 kDa protein 12B-like n=1 Tax=Mytilus edulis TaxID=6550 RepID=UPI0039EF6FB1
MANPLMVVAIDFGTTYSGYAFSTRSDFFREPLKIHANQAWNSGKKQLLSLKTPTCLLLGKNKETVAFGYEAEDAYAELVLDNKHKNYYYFDKFKMRLYENKDVNCEMEIADIVGKKMLATEVFGKSIKALSDHFVDLLKTEGASIEWSEIQWVLTVPAIWSDKAKQFMRTSAEVADIQGGNLLIALEPEAASIYCQYLPNEKLTGKDNSVNLGDDGVIYMIVDLGGGTADLTVHEKHKDGSIKELCRANGEDCGGTSVDAAFIRLFDKISGFAMINKLKKDDPSSYLDLTREFETVKRKIDSSSTGKVNFCIPLSTINSICKKQKKCELEELIQKSSFKNKILIRGDKIRIDADLIKSLFAKPIEKITALVKEMNTQLKATDIPLIVMVGGFSECKLIQSALKQAFPQKRVIVPEDAGISVLKGAVLYGHHPEFIASRVIRYSYGTDSYVDFDPFVHDASRKEIMQGKEKCEVFDFIIHQHTQAVIGSEIQRSYFTMYPFQTAMPITLYVSTKENPKYVDEEGCSKFGEVVVDIPHPSEENRTVIVNYNFGKTELTVSAREVKFGSSCRTRIKLL